MAMVDCRVLSADWLIDDSGSRCGRPAFSQLETDCWQTVTRHPNAILVDTIDMIGGSRWIVWVGCLWVTIDGSQIESDLRNSFFRPSSTFATMMEMPILHFVLSLWSLIMMMMMTIGFRLTLRSPSNNIPVSVLASHCRRWITTKQAQETLGLAPSYTTQELRRAYFAAAKKCHPDALQKNEKDVDVDIAKQFRLVSLAYEKLHSSTTQLHNSNNNNNNQDGNNCWSSSSMDQQLKFRMACQTILGVPAEIVEECKRDAKFRQWLSGNTDAAFYWRNFFSVHGGLAPMLETTAGYLGSSGRNNGEQQKSKTRRKRVPRKGWLIGRARKNDKTRIHQQSEWPFCISDVR